MIYSRIIFFVLLLVVLLSITTNVVTAKKHKDKKKHSKKSEAEDKETEERDRKREKELEDALGLKAADLEADAEEISKDLKEDKPLFDPETGAPLDPKTGKVFKVGKGWGG